MRWALLLLVGCIPEPPGGIPIKGRHVTVHVDPTAIPVCPEAIAVADRFVEDTAAILGVEPRPIDYYMIDGPTGCGYGQYVGANCTLGSTVYANAWIHYHELVHAVDDSHPPALFVEGLAEALSKRSIDVQRDSIDRKNAELDIDSSRFRAGIPWDEYHIAGDFVRFVIERFGGERYRAFARSTLSLSDRISTRRAFATAFGVSFDDVVADWRASSPSETTLRVPIDDVECLDPIAPTGLDTWEAWGDEKDGCESGTSDNGATYTQVTGRRGFDVTNAGVYVVEATDDRGGQKGQVRSCAASSLYEYRTAGNSGAKRFMAVPLAVGRHAIELADGVHQWRVARVGNVGETCETAPMFVPPRDDAWQLDVRGDQPTWLRIEYAGTRWLYGTADSVNAARMCWGACSDLQCMSIASGAAINYVRGQPLYLVLGATASPESSVVVRTLGDDER